MLQFLFPTKAVTEKAQRCYDIYSTLLPICTAAMAGKLILTYCRRVFGCDSNPDPQYSPFSHFRDKP